jgi:hypothetical protein
MKFGSNDVAIINQLRDGLMPIPAFAHSLTKSLSGSIAMGTGDCKYDPPIFT